MGDSMDTFVKYQSAQAITDAAKNQGVAGLGTQIGVGATIAEVMRDSMTTAKQSEGTFCPECGAQNRKNAKFCSECGTKLKVDAVCPKCNAKLAKNAKFCSECGTKI